MDMNPAYAQSVAPAIDPSLALYPSDVSLLPTTLNPDWYSAPYPDPSTWYSSSYPYPMSQGMTVQAGGVSSTTGMVPAGFGYSPSMYDHGVGADAGGQGP